MKEIEKIIAAYERVDWTKEKVALGTVVKVEESAYRRVGARMFVSSNGTWTGGISGGCLEGDALKRAQIAINKNKSSIVVYDTMDDDSHQIGVGLGCNGRIEVMFTPIDPNDPNNPIVFLKSIIPSRETIVVAQVLKDHHKAVLGAFYPEDKMEQMALDTGLNYSDVLEHIESAKSNGKSKVFEHSEGSHDQAEVLIELIRPKVKLICCGDNYDVNAFIPIAKELGWEVHVAGKKRKLNREVFELSDSVVTYEEANTISIDTYTAVVLMSHDYKTDIELIQYFLTTEILYIGLLGPKKRMLKMQKEINELEKEINLEGMPNLFAPVGLDIGAESPEEIALSIAAEIVATLRGRIGQSLKHRSGPIHERNY